jgi:class 3 adenylate cyclase
MERQSHDKEFENYMIASVIRGRSTDIALGFLFYNLFIIWDWYVAPDKFFTLLFIRLSVTTLWLLIVALHDTPFIQKNLRLVYVGLMLTVLNSITLIYSVAFQDQMPADMTLATIILPFCMSAFHVLRTDALIVGSTYVLGFYALFYSNSGSQELFINHIISFVAAFAMGVAGATISQRYSMRAFLDDKRLREETNRADQLLLRTFPFEVAKELKFSSKSPAKRYDQVTVMFCDIVNFTEKSALLQPEALVDWLNAVFSSFDQLVLETGCEKIKTIGDTYMAVCGAPNPSADHAERIVKLALAIQKESTKIFLAGHPVSFRIGINSGPIVAGVIGQSRFAYDLWGDTVNTASRMETLAPLGGILITEATKDLIGDGYPMDQLPALEVKGKGTMPGWLIRDSQSNSKPTNSDFAA